MRVKNFYRLLRSITYFVLFFFCWSYLELFQIPAALAAESRKASGVRVENQGPGARVQGSGGSAERFEKALDEIRENVSMAGEKEDRGEDDTRERDVIKVKRAEIDSAAGEFQKEIAATELKLRNAKLPKEILDRHAKFVKNYTANLKELRANLDDIDTLKADSRQRKAAFTKAKAHLEKVKAPSKHQKIDPNNLPFRARKVGKTREPRLRKDEFERDFPSRKKTRTAFNLQDLLAADSRRSTQILDSGFKSAMYRNPILVASNGSLAGLLSSDSNPPRPLGERIEVRGGFDSAPFAINSFAPNYLLAQLSADTPTADDLAETPEVQFTPEIRDIAAQLGNNSVRLYEAIRNNYQYEPYYGSLKGAQQTIREKAGNDFDLASLLISLYRAAGIPARYVVATISMPLTQAQSWLGIDDPKMVGRLLASAGVPVSVDYLSGNIRIEHVLVQTWVPYQNGRGALNGPGDTWVYVDPSFKETKITQILNQAIPPFDQTQYLSQLRAEDPSEYYSAILQENLDTTAPGRTVYAVARHREIVPLNFGMLLGMPQYDVITIGSYFSEVPDSYRYKIAFELTDPETLESSLAYQASTVELAGKRITLSYGPATTVDQTIIDGHGDLYSTPAYLVKLKPELQVEGVSAAQGLPIGSGIVQPFTMKIISPMGDSEQVLNNAVAGAYYAVAIDLQTVTQGMVYERTQKLRASNDIIVAGGSVSLDDHAGELLYATALTYFQKLDAANRKAQELLKVNDLRGVSEAIFSIDVQTLYLFGMPKSVDVSGVHIDVDRDMHLPIPVDGNTAKIKEFNLLIGSNSSYFEHKVIEDIYSTEAISAVKGLQLANTQGIPVYTINKDNIGAILPTLQARSEIKTDIENAVNAGKEVTIAQNEVTLSDWHGAGFIVMNPQTGEAAYIISGGLAGGSSTGISLFTWIKATALSNNVAVAKETAAIENAIVRDYAIFIGEDNSYGTKDDVRLPYAGTHFVWGALGPAKTKCEGMWSNLFYNPDPDFGGPLLELDAGLMDKKVSKNIKLSDMLVSSGSSSYARISTGLVVALDHYMQLLKDDGITPNTNSVYRTWYHNCELTPQGAVLNSNHMAGIAADVGVSARQAYAAQIALSLFGSVGGVGYKKYKSFVHVDIGKAGREW